MILARGVVVKVGGSLMDVAESVMRVLSQSSVPVLIVPGGGVFANGIRDLGVDGTAAHWMAVSAMDQYGWFCQRLASQWMMFVQCLWLVQKFFFRIGFCGMRILFLIHGM